MRLVDPRSGKGVGGSPCRLAAPPGSSEGGLLTVERELHADCELLFSVPKFPAMIEKEMPVMKGTASMTNYWAVRMMSGMNIIATDTSARKQEKNAASKQIK